MPEPSVEDEVRDNIQHQPIGRHQVADLHVPDDLLRRVTDRIIRSSFEERYRIVVRDAAARTADGDQPSTSQPAVDRVAGDGAIDVRQSQLPPATLAQWRELATWLDRRPSNRAFMPALTERDVPDWPPHEPAHDADPRLLAAANVVARRLAVDGLLNASVDVVTALGPATLLRVDPADQTALRQTGLPVDLLQNFVLPSGESGQRIIEHIALALHGGATAEVLATHMARAAFRFQPTRTGFALATESGEHAAAIVCAHMTRGGYWKGLGDGGNADLLRQAAMAFPKSRIVVSIEQRFAEEFTGCANTWPLSVPGTMTILEQPLPIAQWAQDNAKAGWIIEGVQRRLAMIVPRYASRKEDGSEFVPGDTLASATMAVELGAELVHSPLLFQGGSLLAMRDPKSGSRLLLVGEAEIARNIALGLTAEQAREAFAIEFSGDRCIVLPAVSFHLDYDVSVCAAPSGDELVALVNDPWPAARIILREGTRALQRAGVIDDSTAQSALAALERSDDRAVLDALAPVIFATAVKDERGVGGFPLSLAEHLSTSPVDSGVGNLQRFLLALDLLASRTLRDDELPDGRHARSYLQSLQRLERDRLALHQQLKSLGMRIALVPSISAERRSVTAINGIHVSSNEQQDSRRMYLMPATGGLYAALDDAAAQAIRAALGEGVEVIPILSGESQRRSGAIHCTLSIYPALDEAAAATRRDEQDP